MHYVRRLFSYSGTDCDETYPIMGMCIVDQLGPKLCVDPNRCVFALVKWYGVLYVVSV